MTIKLEQREYITDLQHSYPLLVLGKEVVNVNYRFHKPTDIKKNSKFYVVNGNPVLRTYYQVKRKIHISQNNPQLIQDFKNKLKITKIQYIKEEEKKHFC